jgi:hypothetical protein
MTNAFHGRGKIRLIFTKSRAAMCTEQEQLEVSDYYLWQAG